MFSCALLICFVLASSVCIYTFLSGSPPVFRQVESQVLPVEKPYDHELACRVFLGCLLANLGKEVDRIGDSWNRRLTFEGITLQQTLAGNCSPGISAFVCVDDKNRTPSQMVLAAIKTLGKKGRLTTYTSCYIYPKSCDLWDSSPKDEKYNVTLTLKAPQKSAGTHSGK